MTSKIVVNNIEADSGISTVTFNSNIQGNLIGNVTGNVNSTGVTTVTSLRIGTGTSISSPATNVLTLGTNNLERIRVGAGGSVNIGATDTSYKLQVTGRAVNSNSYGILHIRDEQTLSGAAGTGGIFLSSSPGTDYYIAKGYDGSDTKLIFGNGNNGTEYVKIDSSGRVTMPYQPFVFVTRSGDVSFASGSKIPYDSVLDSRNLTWNTTNNNFVVPVTGVYTFSIYIRLQITNANYIYAQIRSNGSILYNSSVLYLQKPNTLSTFQTVGVTISVKLTQNDTVDVISNWDGTTPATLLALQSSMSIVFNG